MVVTEALALGEAEAVRVVVEPADAVAEADVHTASAVVLQGDVLPPAQTAHTVQTGLPPVENEPVVHAVQAAANAAPTRVL